MTETLPDGSKPSSEQQRALEASLPKLMKVLADEISWERMRAMVAQIYRESFTQEEIDGLIAFY